MARLIMDDIRNIVLALLFLVAFGWMAALVMPGAPADSVQSVHRFAAAGQVIPPNP